MEPQRRQLLRAWIEAILNHAEERVAEADRHAFICREVRALEEDFDVKISVDENYHVEIDYLEKRLLS